MADTPGAGPGPGPPAASGRVTGASARSGRSAGESALVVLVLAALAVALTWPAAAHLGSTVADLGDPVLTTWILAWDVHALTTAPLRLLDANMFHPHRWTLAYTEHLLGLVPLVGPARLAGAGPLLAHNLVWLATFPLTGLTMFWLVRHLTGHAGAAAVAAVLYAFSHFRFGQLGSHPGAEPPVASAHASRAPPGRPGSRAVARRVAGGRGVHAPGPVLGLPGVPRGHRRDALRGVARAPGLAAAPRPLAGAGGPGRFARRAPGPTLAAAAPGGTRPV